MKKISKNYLALFMLACILVSCEKEEESSVPLVYGCTSEIAMNYVSGANTDDGSCIYAHEIAQGTWNINPDCEEYTIPVIATTISLNDQLPPTVDVQAGDGNILYIDINDSQIEGSIDNSGNIIVQKQTVSIGDMGFGPMDVDVEGSGVITSPTNGNMNLTYTFEIETIPLFPITESLDCSIGLTK